MRHTKKAKSRNFFLTAKNNIKWEHLRGIPTLVHKTTETLRLKWKSLTISKMIPLIKQE